VLVIQKGLLARGFNPPFYFGKALLDPIEYSWLELVSIFNAHLYKCQSPAARTSIFDMVPGFNSICNQDSN
jgi:hypothetical protein